LRLPVANAVTLRSHVTRFEAVVDEVLVVKPADGAEHPSEELPVEPGIGTFGEYAEFVKGVPASGDAASMSRKSRAAARL